jgi:thioredoxin reductase
LKEYDLVLNATGASAYVPEVLGLREKVATFEEVLACPKVNCECHPGDRTVRKVGERVLVWGDHYAAADTAEFLASINKKVTIVTDQREFGSKIEVIHMYVLRKRFQQTDAEALTSKPFKYPVDIITNSTLYEIRADEVVIQDKNFNRFTLPVDDVVTAHTRPNVDLLNEMKAAGLKVINVGDSLAVRNLFYAVKEGSAFGLALDEHMLFNPNHAIVNDLPLEVLDQLSTESMELELIQA